MAKIKLHSVKKGKIVDWELSADQNGDIIATNGDEFLKFPGDISKKQLQKLFDEHNKAHKGVKALTPKQLEAQEAPQRQAQELIDSF